MKKTIVNNCLHKFRKEAMDRQESIDLVLHSKDIMKEVLDNWNNNIMFQHEFDDYMLGIVQVFQGIQNHFEDIDSSFERFKQDYIKYESSLTKETSYNKLPDYYLTKEYHRDYWTSLAACIRDLKENITENIPPKYQSPNKSSIYIHGMKSDHIWLLSKIISRTFPELIHSNPDLKTSETKIREVIAQSFENETRTPFSTKSVSYIKDTRKALLWDKLEDIMECLKRSVIEIETEIGRLEGDRERLIEVYTPFEPINKKTVKSNIGK